MTKAKQYARIFLSFCKVGAITFGGGYAMLPILEHEIGEKRGWVEKQELLDYFAMGQTLPGIIAVNVATFCGSKIAGFLGGLVATLGVITPSIVIISLIAAFISNIIDYPLVTKFLFGMNIGVAALLTQSVLQMLKKAVIDPITALLAIAAFVAAGFLGVHSVLVLVIGVVVGLAVKWRPGKSGSREKEGTK